MLNVNYFEIKFIHKYEIMILVLKGLKLSLR